MARTSATATPGFTYADCTASDAARSSIRRADRAGDTASAILAGRPEGKRPATSRLVAVAR
jgi:hypothetical protein